MRIGGSGGVAVAAAAACVSVAARRERALLLMLARTHAGGRLRKCEFPVYDRARVCVRACRQQASLAAETVEREVTAIMQQVHAIRSLPRLGGATVVAIIEMNHCHVRGATLYEGIRKCVAEYERATELRGTHETRVLPYSCDSSDQKKMGVWLDNHMKGEYVVALLQFLLCDGVAVHDPFVPNAIGDVVELRRQLLDFRRVRSQSKSMFIDPRFTYSGKASGMKDDMVVALLMGTRLSRRRVRVDARACAQVCITRGGLCGSRLGATCVVYRTRSRAFVRRHRPAPLLCSTDTLARRRRRDTRREPE